MTTDITELAQSLKAAAIDAKELAIIARYSKGRAAAEKFYALANPNNVIELVEALEKAQRYIEELREWNAGLAQESFERQQRIVELQQGCENDPRIHEIIDLKERIAELESRTVTVKPEDADGVLEEGNQFLVVRHPGKVPVIKHPVGHLEDYLLQILKADPLATIDIVTHRYYGAGGQFVEDADEYLHEMGIKWEDE